MSAKVIHWDFLKNTGALRADDGLGSAIRLDVLLNLIGHANQHNRCWPSLRTISKETGIINRNGIVAALNWLEEHYAIFRVPNDLRHSEEHRLNPTKTVYEITGILALDTGIVPYLLMEEDEIRKAMSFVHDIHDGFKEVPDDDPGDENEEWYGNRTTDGTITVPQGGTVTVPEVIPSLSSTNKTITLVGGGVAPATSEGHRLAPPALFASKSKTLPGKEDDSDSEDTSLANHDLGKLLLTTFGQKTFTREEAKAIKNQITYKDERGRKHEAGSVLELWDTEAGYQEFAKGRVAQFKALKDNGRPIKLVTVINGLAWVDKVVEGKGWPGWYQWRAQNPDVCRGVELKASDFLTPEQEEKGYTFEVIDGVPTTIPPKDSKVRIADLPIWMQAEARKKEQAEQLANDKGDE